ILERYLATAPYGGNIEGVRAASLAWFGREPARLTLAQAALLIALPQSPEARRPDRNPAAALRARNRVIDRLEAAGKVSARDAREARADPVPKVRQEVPRLAPHLSDRLASDSEPGARIKTTLDATWQAALEPLARHRAALTSPRASAAIVVAEHATGALRAAVGSAGLLDSARAGFVDMTTALRSPGSALKPFIYGVAFDDGLVAPGTLIDDEPSYFAGYEPENFSGKYRGTVTVAEALRDSLNVPAVALLARLGPQRFAARLTAAGATVALPGEGAPGLALGLGGLGISLMDLAMLSTALASDGWPRPLHATGNGTLSPASLLSRRAARNIAGILATVAPPRNGRMGELAYKTGTSYGHRDAWAVGFDGTHVIAVWVGRPDGTPIAGLTGWGDAAPLLFDAFARIGTTPLPALPEIARPSELPPPLQRFTPPGTAASGDTPALAIAFPPEGARVVLPGAVDGQKSLIARTIGARPLLWLLNGRPVDAPARRTAAIPVTQGPHTLTVIAADGASSRVSFKVE
ncbi:MAG: transglycosylase domain-containing protein, partial [Pseudomonadota bacterium]